jgi:hypothetical protein
VFVGCLEGCSGDPRCAGDHLVLATARLSYSATSVPCRPCAALWSPKSTVWPLSSSRLPSLSLTPVYGWEVRIRRGAGAPTMADSAATSLAVMLNGQRWEMTW